MSQLLHAALIAGGGETVADDSATEPPVADEAAVASTAVPAHSSRPRATASLREGFGVRSHDGAFSSSLGFLGQMRYGATIEHADMSQGFELRLARPVLQAKLFNDRVRARLMPEFAGGAPRLLDATATITAHEAFAVQLGQFRPWVSRGFRIGLPVQALPDRGAVLDAFRVDRDVGLTVIGRPFGGRLEYYVGVFNGDGPNATNVDDQLLYTARVVVAPLGPVPYDQTPYVDADDDVRVAVGLGGYTVEVDQARSIVDTATGEIVTVPLPDRRDIGGSADLAISGPRFAALAEGFWRRSLQAGAPPSDAWGSYGQIAALLVRRRLDATLRAGVLDSADGTGLHVPIEAGFNVYVVGHHAKLQFRYTCWAAVGGCELHQAIVQAQLAF